MEVVQAIETERAEARTDPKGAQDLLARTAHTKNGNKINYSTTALTSNLLCSGLPIQGLYLPSLEPPCSARVLQESIVGTRLPYA